MTAQTFDPSLLLPPSIQVPAKTLAKASLGAAAVAAVLLVTCVLPAEAGIDPTGIGGMLGIAGMATGEAQAETETGPALSPAGAAPASAPAALPSRTSIERASAMRSDTMTIALPPHSGKEVKAHMNAGDSFVFEWKASGPLKVDMHGEHPNAAEGEFTSYWKERELASAKGDFTAPFEGTHGWYWRNKGDTPVTITVKTTGFYKDLFRPGE
ncbi:hypothetical protein [Novosphingobium sp. KA1]|uniref:hypothetical protein n=1 Tax=Novosphingobium sp. (strain KA1) TaxID=164608 RepID=UPI001A8DD879|nr:hypothetical protein [Novosphingobium sp. KA1]QSR19987.1 hypothetical protein CA833_22830 [Novosphingobium sp. KA1]